ncbi:hypothetical protein HPB50_025887 [Hyalomma asiaticum]|uniref:Uncharacterized protein n=1 Tax=Hyalomma asiaticum TaxID=266040 RepID=A0ACB7T213_HYAAI|nr:hypothetical protein HPB50_025887 [Hyalomma asiaticum]
MPLYRVVYREWTCAMLVPVYGPTAADAGRRKTADGGLPAQAAAATAAPAPPTAAAAAAEGSLAQPPPPPPAPSPMKPCREFCHRVEEQCPYFHPAAREQYAGEPVFICIGAATKGPPPLEHATIVPRTPPPPAVGADAEPPNAIRLPGTTDSRAKKSLSPAEMGHTRRDSEPKYAQRAR